MKPKHLKAYMKCAEAFAECSNAEKLKVGCVLVRDNGIISEGYNGLPEHLTGPLEDEDFQTKPEVRHAEINALKKLTRSTQSSVGATLILTHNPCKLCAIEIVDAKIETVYYKNRYRSDDGLHYLLDNGVNVHEFRGGENPK